MISIAYRIGRLPATPRLDLLSDLPLPISDIKLPDSYSLFQLFVIFLTAAFIASDIVAGKFITLRLHIKWPIFLFEALSHVVATIVLVFTLYVYWYLVAAFSYSTKVKIRPTCHF